MECFLIKTFTAAPLLVFLSFGKKTALLRNVQAARARILSSADDNTGREFLRRKALRTGFLRG
jgi:hypothetical protein